MKLGRWVSLAVGWSLVAGVMAPVFLGASDDFPFSTYPMFTADRSRVELVVMLQSDTQASLLQGEKVPPDWIAGQEVMMAMTTIKHAVWGGPPQMLRLCGEVRAQAAKRQVQPKALAFVVEGMDVLARVNGQDVPNQRRLLFMCPSGEPLR